MTRTTRRRVARLEHMSPRGQVHIVFGMDPEDLARKLAAFEASGSAGPRDLVYGISWQTEDVTAAGRRGKDEFHR